MITNLCEFINSTQTQSQACTKQAVHVSTNELNLFVSGTHLPVV